MTSHNTVGFNIHANRQIQSQMTQIKMLPTFKEGSHAEGSRAGLIEAITVQDTPRMKISKMAVPAETLPGILKQPEEPSAHRAVASSQ
jgi:hypothetical protein